MTPTRRVALGHLVLPVDPAPGFGGLLLGAVIAAHLPEVDDELVPDIHRLLDQIARGERITQPRLRHRYQVDRHGLAVSVHRLQGEGDNVHFDLRPKGSPLAQVLGAVYARRAARHGGARVDARADPASRDALARSDRPVVHRQPRRRRRRIACRRWPIRGRGRSTCSASRSAPARSRRRTSRRATATGCAASTPTTAATRTSAQQGDRRSRRGAADPDRMTQPSLLFPGRGCRIATTRCLVAIEDAATAAIPKLHASAPTSRTARRAGARPTGRRCCSQAVRDEAKALRSRTSSCSAAGRWAGGSARWRSATRTVRCRAPGWC